MISSSNHGINTPFGLRLRCDVDWTLHSTLHYIDRPFGFKTLSLTPLCLYINTIIYSVPLCSAPRPPAPAASTRVHIICIIIITLNDNSFINCNYDTVYLLVAEHYFWPYSDLIKIIPLKNNTIRYLNFANGWYIMILNVIK